MDLPSDSIREQHRATNGKAANAEILVAGSGIRIEPGQCGSDEALSTTDVAIEAQ